LHTARLFREIASTTPEVEHILGQLAFLSPTPHPTGFVGVGQANPVPVPPVVDAGNLRLFERLQNPPL
jgi:hypothetical protein